MNEFENKGVEKFFRSKLKSTNQNNDWASPPDFIFEKAIDQVNKEEKDKKRTFLFWLSLLGFVVILSTIILAQSKQLNDVKKSLDKLEEELITSQLNSQDNTNTQNFDKDSAKQLNKNYTSNSGASIIENNLSLNTALHKQTANHSIQKNSSTLLSPSRTTSHSTSKSFTLQKNELVNDNANIGITENLQFSPPVNYNSTQNRTGLFNKTSQAVTSITHSKKRSLLQFIPIISLSHSALDIEYSNLLAVPQFVDGPTNESDFNNGFSIAVISGINASTLLMDNMNNLNGKSLTDYNKYYSGIQSELSVLYRLTSRFSVGVHANYSKINNRSSFEESSSLDFTNMRFVNGKMEYSMPMNIFTPIGSHKMNSDITFDENLNTSNLIRNQSDINQSINSLGIGVSARYSFVQKSKFSSFVGVGFTHHFSNTTNSMFNTTISMQDKVMKKFKTYPDYMTDNQKTFNSVSAQIGVEYEIAPKTKISFQSSFGKSINSLRQTNIKTDPQTHLQYINTAIGISYSL